MHTKTSWVGRLRWRHATLTLLVIGILLWASVRLSDLPPQVNLAVNARGALVLSVFGGVEPEPLDRTGLPERVRQRLETYLTRLSAFASRLPEPAPGTPEHLAWVARVRVERAIVALIDVPGIADQAATFAAGAQIAPEWTDASGGPLTEARDAEAYLEAHPTTPLKPYLWLFLMHRYKAAIPRLRSEGAHEADVNAVATTYARYRALAAGFSDPLIGLIAGDIDNVASVDPVRRTAPPGGQHRVR